MSSNFIKIIAFILGLFLIINLSRSIFDLWQKGGLLDKEEERFARARLNNEELTKEYQDLQSPEYIEKQARDKLGLGKEGEVAIVLPPQETQTETQQQEKTLSTWEQWLNLLIE